ncbi:FAD-binding protein [Xanthobacter wiegelii]|uniref:FAD-binding protein n=1 Tax=Xanthobacter wiegelii TaxID=3119913 RepID=UPI00372C9F8B
MSRPDNDQEFDVVVVGSGAGGLLGAIKAADAGLKAIVVEKAALLGGTTAISGGAIWVPCNDDQARAGIKDDLADAFTYVKTCARGLSSDERILAYVETARHLARYLGSIGVAYRCMPLYSDYYPGLPGARPGGRTMDAVDYDAALLGPEQLATMRRANPGQLILGRVAMSAFDAHTILSGGRGSVSVVLKHLLRYFMDYPWRMVSRIDRRMTGGQALIAALLDVARRRNVTIWTESPLTGLITAEGRVTGIVVERSGQACRIGARRGVLIAAGGFEWNQEMRDAYLPKPTQAQWSATPAGGNTGDGIRAGAKAGGALRMMEQSWGCPTIIVPGEDKARGVFVERAMPGAIVVNQRGERFVNESGPYPEFQQAMYANHAATGGAVPAFVIFDAAFRARYPMGPVMPKSLMPDSKVPAAWWDKVVWKADTLEALASKIGVDAAGLARTAARFAGFARTGKDEDFDRGGNSFDRYYSDVNIRPNPSLAPLAKAPFYAMLLWPGEIGTKGGLLTDLDARVLDVQGQAIPGLYCVGNASASVMGPSYPGAGSTLGPAMTFAYRAVADMSGAPIALEHRDLLGVQS